MAKTKKLLDNSDKIRITLLISVFLILIVLFKTNDTLDLRAESFCSKLGYQEGDWDFRYRCRYIDVYGKVGNWETYKYKKVEYFWNNDMRCK